MYVEAYSPVWFAFVALIPIAVIVITGIYRKKPMEERIRFMKRLCLLSMAVYVLYKGYALFDPGYETTVWRELPLNLCNLGIFLAYPALTKRFSVLRPFVVFVCILGTFCGILMPDALHSKLLILDPICIGFYATHILGAVMLILFLTLDIYEPRMKDIWISVLTTLIITLLIHVVNMALRATGLEPGANFIFTYGLKENRILSLLWSFIPVPYLYQLPAYLLLLIFDFLLYGLIKLIKKVKF